MDTYDEVQKTLRECGRDSVREAINNRFSTKEKPKKEVKDVIPNKKLKKTDAEVK